MTGNSFPAGKPWPRIGAVGRFDGELAACLAELRPLAEICSFVDPRQAARNLADDPSWDLAMMAQARPGERSQAELEALQSAAPLMPIVVLLGSWSAGELRSGRPLRGAWRCYYHQFRTRLLPEIRRWRVGAPPAWLDPRADEEQWFDVATESAVDDFQDATDRLRRPSPLIALAGPYLLRETARDLCRALGCATVEFDFRANLRGRRGTQGVLLSDADSELRLRGITAAVWSGDSMSPVEATRLARLAALVHPAPTLAALAWPQGRDEGVARQAGASQVVGQPLLLSDLAHWLNELAIGASPLARAIGTGRS